MYKKNKTRTEYAMMNIVTGLGGYIVNTVLGFICRMIFVRCLNQEYLGISGLFTNILSMLSLAELGVGSAIVYALYKPLAENDEEKILSLVDFYRKAYRTIGIAIGIIGICIMPFVKYIVGDYSFKENLYIIYLLYLGCSVVSYFFSYRSSLLQAAQKQYIVSSVSYTRTIIQSLLQMIFLILTHQYIIYLIIQFVCSIADNIIISYIATKEYPIILSKNPKPLSHEEISGLTKNVWYLMTNKLASLLLSSTDNIITSYFQGIITVGIASNYVLLTNTLGSLLGQFFNGLTGSVGNYNVLKNEKETESLFLCFYFANFWLYGIGSLGVALVSSDLVKLFFGPTYILDDGIPTVLALNFFLTGMMSSVWTFKNALGQFKYGRYVVLLTGFLNILFSIVMGKHWGLFGIYLATIVARLLTNAWYEPYALFKYSLHRSSVKYFVVFIKYLIIMVITFIIEYYLCHIFKAGAILELIWHIFVVVIITNIIIVIIFRKTEEFKFLKNKVNTSISLVRMRINKK